MEVCHISLFGRIFICSNEFFKSYEFRFFSNDTIWGLTEGKPRLENIANQDVLLSTAEDKWIEISVGCYSSVAFQLLRDLITIQHYCDVIIASQVTSLTIVYSAVQSVADNKKKIKAPHHWLLCGEFTGDRWIPRTNGQQRLVSAQRWVLFLYKLWLENSIAALHSTKWLYCLKCPLRLPTKLRCSVMSPDNENGWAICLCSLR